MRERHIARAVNPLTLARLLRCLVTKSDAILAREYPLGKPVESADVLKASVRTERPKMPTADAPRNAITKGRQFRVRPSPKPRRLRYPNRILLPERFQ